MYVISDIWQGIGWGSIIYIAAISGISAELYEAARIDGAGRWKQALHVTIPGILPTIITMLILRIGNMMSLGFEKLFFYIIHQSMKPRTSFPHMCTERDCWIRATVFNGSRAF